ncbi:glycosyltransferase family 2 protein [Cylindrospermum sp. FACHB-282]|uniref:glycosyltransferase family 2 protein n=1 Tax=Cylindrospermum sp. FACHB-282 TaxID=2692794 RepID=UPI0018F0101A|nr:glycosyltransferase family 2 protein [Cylindrospermum sp. FACHB-282]
MQNKPLVSVITPFFNAQMFFVEAIESVIFQTYEHWELFLVDDGSTDESTIIAQKYAAQYPDKIHYLEHPEHQNRGKSTSRNLGINRAKGKYIALLDADDVFLPQKLEKQVAILESQPETAMVYGPTLYWYGWTGKPEDIRRDFLSKLGVEPNTVFSPPTLLNLFLQDGGILPCTCGLLARRQIVENTGGFDEAIQHMYEDQVFLAKIALESPVFVEGGCWDKYRQHRDSSSYVAMRTGEYHPYKLNSARQIFLNWLAKYIADRGVKNLELDKSLQKALWPYRHPKLYNLISQIRYFIKKLNGQLECEIQQSL